MPTGISATESQVRQMVVEWGFTPYVELLEYSGSMTKPSLWLFKKTGETKLRAANKIFRKGAKQVRAGIGGGPRITPENIEARLKTLQPHLWLIWYAGTMDDDKSMWFDTTCNKPFPRAARHVLRTDVKLFVGHPDNQRCKQFEIEIRLKELRPNLSLVLFVPNMHNPKSIWFDHDVNPKTGKPYGEFPRSASAVLNKKFSIVGHPDKKTRPSACLSKEYVDTRVNERHPHVTLLQYCGTTQGISIWLDADYGTFPRAASKLLYGPIGSSGHPDRIAATNVENNTIYPELKPFCVNTNITYTWMCSLLRDNPKRDNETYEEWYVRARAVHKDGTKGERIVRDFLDSLGVEYRKDRHLEDSGKRPDFIIENCKLIIEVDGLKWHCDEFKGRSAHKKRRELFEKYGYRVLAFTDLEVYTKFNIVKSMILSRLGLVTNTIYARKCKLVKLLPHQATDFFEANHMKGGGSGRSFALTYNDDIVCAIRYKKDDCGIMHVNRFASKLNTSVPGGYSRLLKKMPIRPLVSFVDCRYGDGHSLLQAGFKLIKIHVGFMWTNRDNIVLSRWTHKGNSGYAVGLYKIWDYGQMKWVLEE